MATATIKNSMARKSGLRKKKKVTRTSTGNFKKEAGDVLASTKSKKTRPLIVFKVDGEQINIIEESMKDEPTYNTVVTKLNGAEKPVQVAIDHIFRHDKETRVKTLRLLNSLKCRFRFYTGRPPERFDDLMSAILSNLVRHDDDPDKHDLVLEIAKQWAAIKYKDDLNTACKRIRSKLSELGVTGISRESLIRDSKRIGKEIGKSVKMLEISAIDKPTAQQIAAAYLKQISDGDDDPALPVLLKYQDGFYEWSGNKWILNDDAIFKDKVARFTQSIESVNVTAKMTNDVIHNLAAMTSVPCKEPMPFEIKSLEPFEMTDAKFIVFRNGMLDLKAIEEGSAEPVLVPVDRMYFNGVTLPYDYNPDAQCSLWLKTLDEILPKTGDGDNRQSVLQEFCGYTLMPHCRFQKMIILLGDGGNGKSTLTRTWEAVLGMENIGKTPLEALSKDFRLEALNGKLANFSGELNFMGRVNESLVKQLVEGETVEAPRKFKQAINFSATAKWIINTNDLPVIQDKTEGIWSRLITVPFLETFRGTNKQDFKRIDRLSEELPGIFNWMLAGAKRLIERNGFSKCDVCSALVDKHRTDTDSVRLFVSECFTEVEARDAVIYSIPMFEFYKWYCGFTNNRPTSKEDFGKRMKRMGHESRQGKTNNRAYRFAGLNISEEGAKYREKMKKEFDAKQNHHSMESLGFDNAGLDNAGISRMIP